MGRKTCIACCNIFFYCPAEIKIHYTYEWRHYSRDISELSRSSVIAVSLSLSLSFSFVFRRAEISKNVHLEQETSRDTRKISLPTTCEIIVRYHEYLPLVVSHFSSSLHAREELNYRSTRLVPFFFGSRRIQETFAKCGSRVSDGNDRNETACGRQDFLQTRRTTIQRVYKNY